MLLIVGGGCSSGGGKGLASTGGGKSGSGGASGAGGAAASGTGGMPGGGGSGSGAGGAGGRASGTGGDAGGGSGNAGNAGMTGGAGLGGDGGACACQGDREWIHGPVTAAVPQASDYTWTVDTVTDKVTGLVWQRTMQVLASTWPISDTYCNNLTLDGHDDWSLPTLIELDSLLSYGRTKPAIELTAFPTTLSGEEWTSTPLAGFSDSYWTVNFATGETSFPAATEMHGGRCVRCGCAGLSGSTMGPGARFVAATDTVADTTTGLTWQRVAEPADGLGGYNWADAGVYCRSLALAGQSSWRLPTPKELQSIVDIRKRQPAMNTSLFQGPMGADLWSSEPDLDDATLAFSVIFSDGAIIREAVSDRNEVRCVR